VRVCFFFDMRIVFNMRGTTTTTNSARDSQSRQGIVNLTVAGTTERDPEDKTQRCTL